MNELLERLKAMSTEYKRLSDALELADDEEEYYPDNDAAFDDGKSQAYWRVRIELDEVISEFPSNL